MPEKIPYIIILVPTLGALLGYILMYIIYTIVDINKISETSAIAINIFSLVSSIYISWYLTEFILYK